LANQLTGVDTVKNHQFEFSATNGQRQDSIRCTAPNEEYARAQARLAYPSYQVGDCVKVREAHAVVGEIDASDMTESDYQYCLINIK